MGNRLIATVAWLLTCAAAHGQAPPPMEPPGPLAPVGPPPAIRHAPVPSAANPLPSLDALGFGGPIFAPSLSPSADQQLPSTHALRSAPTSPAPASVDPTDPSATDAFIWGPAPLSGPVPNRAWVWGSAEFLIGSTAGVRVPPVVTTGIPFSAGGGGGLLNGLGTTPLFGGRKLLDNWRTGMKTEVGAWFGREHAWGASARLYSLFSTSDQFDAVGDGRIIINVPQRITVVTVGGVVDQVPIYVSQPPEFGIGEPITGTVATTAQTTFTGGDINLRRLIVSNMRFRYELFTGYRQMHLGDELGAVFLSQSGPSMGFRRILGDDSVRTRNNFYGTQVGGLGSLAFGRLSLQGTSSVALGVSASDLDFSRARTASSDGNVFFIERSTLGGRVNYFSVAAELGARIGFRVTEHAKLTIGYTGIYWTQVRRAQEQFDLSPTPTGDTTNFYSNMFSVGGEMRY